LRATAPFEGEGGEANTLAGYLIILMSLVVACVASATTIRMRVVLTLVLVLQVSALFYTLSRTGWVGTFFAFICLFLLIKKGRNFMVGIIAVGLLLAPVIVPKAVHQRVHDTFVGDEQVSIFGKKITLDESSMARVQSAQRSIQRWVKNPIIGAGVTSAGAVSDVQYTRILCEVGLIGFTIFGWLMYAVFVAGLTTYRDLGVSLFGQNISAAFLSSLAGLLVMGFASEVFIIIRIMEPFWFIAAIIATLPAVTRETNISMPPLVTP